MSLEVSTAATIQYCMLVISEKSFNRGKRVEVDFGESDILLNKFSDSAMQTTLKVGETTTIIDALNYMTIIGWELVHLMPFSTNTEGGNFEIYRYLMKRAVK